jgi:hypothetical protein
MVSYFSYARKIETTTTFDTFGYPRSRREEITLILIPIVILVLIVVVIVFV